MVGNANLKSAVRDSKKEKKKREQPAFQVRCYPLLYASSFLYTTMSAVPAIERTAEYEKFMSDLKKFHDQKGYKIKIERLYCVHVCLDHFNLFLLLLLIELFYRPNLY